MYLLNTNNNLQLINNPAIQHDTEKHCHGNPSCMSYVYSPRCMKHRTPASSECTQLCCFRGLALHLTTDVSCPAQSTLSRSMSPDPLPK